jgi:glycosyltransferase involved in cell wall biosynthesis
VRWFAESILPAVRRSRPSTRLLVTGVPLSGFEPAGVEQTGLLGDVRSTIASAWAEVVPLLSGSGTRVKVLEALALGTPVVSTSKGVEGLDVVPERDLLVADAADSFAQATCRLLADPLLRARLAEAGRQLVQSRYDWPASQRAWRCLAESVAEARPATLDLH